MSTTFLKKVKDFSFLLPSVSSVSSGGMSTSSLLASDGGSCDGMTGSWRKEFKNPAKYSQTRSIKYLLVSPSWGYIRLFSCFSLSAPSWYVIIATLLVYLNPCSPFCPCRIIVAVLLWRVTCFSVSVRFQDFFVWYLLCKDRCSLFIESH